MSSLTIATVNVNGIRAAHRKGLIEWMESSGAQIIAMQEVRANEKEIMALIDDLGGLKRNGGKWYFNHDEASAKGRAGVALFSTSEPLAIRTELGPTDFDSAGRWLEADYQTDQGPLTVVSVYVHSGEVDTDKQVEKYKFLDAMEIRMSQLRNQNQVLVMGDLNVGHTELDIKNWKGNIKNSGFLPEERAYFDTLMKTQGWVDIGRHFHPETPGPYSWWSYRGQAFDNDAGWRIDYQLATSELAKLAQNYRVDRAPSYDSRWSDHSPVIVDYKLRLEA